MHLKQHKDPAPWNWGAIFAVLVLIAHPGSGAAETAWNVGISGGSKGIEGFHVSIGEFYRVPKREVVLVHQRGIAEEELPVVFFLSQRARVSPNVLVDMRLKQMSWMDITLHLGLNPEIYYVPVTAHHHPPYGKAYGYYRNHPPHTWRNMRLSDSDIVNQVNLGFLSHHYGHAPEHIMRYRGEGRGFVSIDQTVRREHESRAKNKTVNKSHYETSKVIASPNNGKNKNHEVEWGPQKGPHRQAPQGGRAPSS